ncbi:MAG: hypothetical protein NTY38_32125, partial [Acidobacteria bacterium]|nr:hypothetical protein [Acidobacteriota bacterium]
RYGISFEEPFYLDQETRIANDILMRRALHERFGIGAPDPQPRPVIGSHYIAGGFVVPALLGVPIRFTPNQAAWNIPRDLDREAILALRVPDLQATWPMNLLIRQMDRLERQYGYLSGDLNTGGVFNTGAELRGNDLFMDLVEDPELTNHLFDVVAATTIAVARYVRSRTGTTSVAVNRSIASVDRALHLVSNCSVSMMSPGLYQQRVLPFDLRLAESLAPVGIHHCGFNLHRFGSPYNQLSPRFLDVGAGSDVEACHRIFPGAFLNLRVNPVRMLQQSATEIYAEVLGLLRDCGRRANVGVCCINMDGETPDDNVKAMFAAAHEYDRETACEA